MKYFINIHKDCNWAKPDKKSLYMYKHALPRPKLCHTQLPEVHWIALSFQQTITTRQMRFHVIKTILIGLETITSQIC